MKIKNLILSLLLLSGCYYENYHSRQPNHNNMNPSQPMQPNNDALCISYGDLYNETCWFSSSIDEQSYNYLCYRGMNYESNCECFVDRPATSNYSNCVY